MSWLSTNAFMSNAFRENGLVPQPTAPVPAAVSVASGGGASWGWMGGGSSAPSRRKKPSSHAFGKEVAKNILSGLKSDLQRSIKEGQNKKAVELAAQREAIRQLRERVTKLEAHIRDLKGSHESSLEGLAFDMVDQLKTKEALEGVIEELETTLKVEVVRATAYREAVERAGRMMGAYVADHPPRGLPRLIIGAIAYLAVEFLVPDRMGALKDMGRMTSAGVAISGLVRLIQ
jgi:cell division protein FtsB